MLAQGTEVAGDVHCSKLSRRKNRVLEHFVDRGSDSIHLQYALLNYRL